MKEYQGELFDGISNVCPNYFDFLSYHHLYTIVGVWGSSTINFQKLCHCQWAQKLNLTRIIKTFNTKFTKGIHLLCHTFSSIIKFKKKKSISSCHIISKTDPSTFVAKTIIREPNKKDGFELIGQYLNKKIAIVVGLFFLYSHITKLNKIILEKKK